MPKQAVPFVGGLIFLWPWATRAKKWGIAPDKCNAGILPAVPTASRRRCGGRDAPDNRRTVTLRLGPRFTIQCGQESAMIAIPLLAVLLLQVPDKAPEDSAVPSAPNESAWSHAGRRH